MHFKFFAASIAAIAAPVAIAAVPTAAQEAAAKFSTQLPIETLMADDAARAVVLKHMPGLDQHPAYDQMKGMSLRTIMPYSQGRITPETLDAIDADLATL